MARSDHSRYTAADRLERRAARQPRRQVRRTGTRRAALALAIQEA